jgi:hypothetical protein
MKVEQIRTPVEEWPSRDSRPLDETIFFSKVSVHSVFCSKDLVVSAGRVVQVTTSDIY